MSEETVPQRDPAPGSAPGTLTGQMPQASPAADQGPDSHKLPQLSDVVAGSDRDYEASFKGLNVKYQEEKKGWETEKTQFASALQKLQGQIEQLKQTPPPQSPAQKASPEPQAKPSVSTGNTTTDSDELGKVVDGLKAQRAAKDYLDLMLDDYTKPGAPGDGLPLRLFAEQIAVKPPDMTGGQIDDSAQRLEIEAMIGKLKQVTGTAKEETAQSLMEGWTPGSAASVPRGDQTAEAVYDEFLKLTDLRGQKEYNDMPQADQDRLDARYYELLQDPNVKLQHGGSTGPLSWEDVVDSVTNMGKQIAQMQATQGGFNPLKTGI